MSNSHPLPPKKEVALALLERSNDRGIFVHLDPRLAAVIVPPWFKKQPQLVLQIGLNMPVPIPDLRLDDDGMSCTLSFNRSPFYCVVPWSSVFAMVGEDGRGMVWPDDVPAEVPLSRQGQEQRPPATPAPPPSMRALDGARKDPKGPAAKAESDGAKAKRPRKRPPLAAVPDGESSGVGGSSGSKKGKASRGDRAPATPRAVVSSPPSPAATSPRRSPGAGKPATPARGSGKKRELPPYLRVVK
jgi:hypothetical protein